jgi:hypothetical protein
MLGRFLSCAWSQDQEMLRDEKFWSERETAQFRRVSSLSPEQCDQYGHYRSFWAKYFQLLYALTQRPVLSQRFVSGVMGKFLLLFVRILRIYRVCVRVCVQGGQPAARASRPRYAGATS